MNNPSVEDILRTVIDAVIVIDETGLIQSVNPAVEKIFGYSPNEVMGKNVSLLMPVPYSREHNGYIRKYLQTGKAKIIGLGREALGKKKDGTVFPIYLGVSQGRKKGGRLFFTGVIRDITEIKRYQDELKAQGEFTAAVLDTARSLVMVLDPRGHIVNFNRACEETTGYAFEEVAGKPFWAFFIAPEEKNAAIKNFLHAENLRSFPSHFETQWLTKKKEKRLILWSNSALFDKKGSLAHVIAAGIDITERRRLERMVLEISQKERHRIGQELHDSIAQDLATTAIAAKVLEKKLTDGSLPAAKEAKRVVGMINQAITQTRELAQGLYGQVMGSEDLVASLKKLAKETEKTVGIRCVVLSAGNVHIPDGVAATHLYRIAREAVSNAVKHGHPKNIRIQLSRKSAREGELRVENDGKKLPKKPFKEKGLGMHIMHSRAVMLNASLAVSPKVKGGTMVTCIFPIAS